MAGRTTFVIAHRLSTISLADEIVVLEDGELVAARRRTTSCSSSSDLYREIVEKGLPDQVFLTRKPARAGGGGPVSPQAPGAGPTRRRTGRRERPRCAGGCAAPAAAGASCAASPCCCGPTAARVAR